MKTYEIRPRIQNHTKVDFVVFENGVECAYFWAGVDEKHGHSIAGAYESAKEFVEDRKSLWNSIQNVMGKDPTNLDTVAAGRQQREDIQTLIDVRKDLLASLKRIDGVILR